MEAPTLVMLHRSMIEQYTECPKFATIMFHTDQTDPSEFYTVWTGEIWDMDTRQLGIYCEKRIFTVPKQRLLIYEDKKDGKFAVVRVASQELHNEFWLVASIRVRRGFLIPLSAFDPSQYREHIEMVEQE